MEHLQVAEISRVLRPGGVFVASTFLAPNTRLPGPLARQARQVGTLYPVSHSVGASSGPASVFLAPIQWVLMSGSTRWGTSPRDS